MAYVRSYRTGMHEQYGSTLREALAARGQQAGLMGRSLSPDEIAAIARGVLTPYLDPYGSGLQEAYEMDVQQAQYEKDLALEKEALKQQEKAAETAAVGQAGSAAVAGGALYEKYYGTRGGETSAGSASYGGAYSESAGATTGGGTGTTQGGYWSQGGWGNAFAFVGGGMVGYGVSPYGQQMEEGTGRPGALVVKPLPGGHSERGGERLGMMATGAGAGYLSTGGSPAGAIGGAVGGYFQENPETGKRGYQESYSWHIKPAWKGAVHDIKSTATTEFAKKSLQPRSQIEKGWKRAKKLW